MRVSNTPAQTPDNSRVVRKIHFNCSTMHLPHPALSNVLLLGPTFRRGPLCLHPEGGLQTKPKRAATKLLLKVFSGKLAARTHFFQRCPFLLRDCPQAKCRRAPTQKCGLRVFLRLSALRSVEHTSFHTCIDNSSQAAACACPHKTCQNSSQAAARNAQSKCPKMASAMSCFVTGLIARARFSKVLFSALRRPSSKAQRGTNKKLILSTVKAFSARIWR